MYCEYVEVGSARYALATESPARGAGKAASVLCFSLSLFPASLPAALQWADTDR